MPAGHQALIRLGGKPAVGLFVLTLLAFVAETQLSQVRPYSNILCHHVRLLNCSAVCASRSGIPTTIPHFVGALLTTLSDITLIPAQLYRSLVFRGIIPSPPLVSLCILSVLPGLALDKRARCRTKTSRPEGSKHLCCETCLSDGAILPPSSLPDNWIDPSRSHVVYCCHFSTVSQTL